MPEPQPPTQELELEDAGATHTQAPAQPDATQSIAPEDSRPAKARQVPRSFQPGARVAGRYQILRLIARGGMGEVFEAQDLELRGVLALKTIRADLVSKTSVVERFKREIQIARQITHPNISRVYDLEKHKDEGGEVWFLTMELLRGETLSQWLQGRAGKLSFPEALPIIEQMARGLGAIHKVGVVHRDFKSANVMLVPASAQGWRVVVMDFGLARGLTADELPPESAADSGSSSPLLTAAGAILGTPAYMAPEQALGQELTPAADIYALGVVMYEMATGRLPFTGQSAHALIQARLHSQPQRPRELKPELEPRWEELILKCLEREPGHRYPTIEALLKELRPPPPPILQTRPIRKTWKLAGALALLLALSLPSLVLWWQKPAVRRAVAILGFKNQGPPNGDWLSLALTETLRSRLAAGGQVRLLPAEDIHRARKELHLDSLEDLDSPKLQAIRNNLAADLLLHGSYRQEQSRLKVEFELQDLGSGRLLKRSGAEGTEEQLFALSAQVGDELRHALELDELGASSEQALKAEQPTHPNAMRLYVQGLEKLRNFEILAAQDLLRQAIDVEPQFPVARRALAQTLLFLGKDSEAREQAKQALRLAQERGLPMEEQREFEAYRANVDMRWADAGKVYNALWILHPDDLETGLGYAKSLIWEDRFEDALQTLQTLQNLPPPLGNDPRIFIYQARTAALLGGAEKALAITDRGIAEARKRNAPLLMADAESMRSWILYHQGNYQGSFQSALAAKQMALKADADENEIAILSIHLGGSFLGLGKLQDAHQEFQQSVKYFRHLGSPVDLQNALHSEAIALIRLGKLAEAHGVALEAFNLSQTTHLPSTEGEERILLGWIAHLQGANPEAVHQLDSAIEIFTRLHGDLNLAWAQWHRAQVYKNETNFSQARKLLQASLQLRAQNNLNVFAQESQLGLAELALREANWKEAETLARQSIAALANSNSAENEAWAQQTLAWSLLGQKDLKNAERESRVAAELSNQLENPMLRWKAAQLQVALNRALSPDSPTTGSSVNALQNAINEARSAGFQELVQELEAELSRK